MKKLLAILILVSCKSVSPDFDSGVDDTDDGGTDADTDADTDGDGDTDTETQEADAVEECKAGIAAWYELGCMLTCDSNDVPVGCSWSTTDSAPLSIGQAQAFCELWASPACLEYLEVMLDCWAEDFDAEAQCPALCLYDYGAPPVTDLLEDCLEE